MKDVATTRVVLLILAFLSAGCSSERADLTLRGEESPRSFYAQSFDQAFVGRSGDGEYDIVLARRQAPDHARPQRSWKRALSLTGTPAAQPLQPVQPSQTFEQVVHIHVFWKGIGGSAARDGVVTNSTIDWYVIQGVGATSDGPQVLRYEGAAYVMMKERGKSASIDIRDGHVRKKDSTGDLHDPIGPAALTGSVDAVRNDQIVRRMLAELKAQVQPPSAATATPVARAARGRFD
jgi:hypothetical protein